MNILFRCDGSHEIGLGHVVRCMALADELCEIHGCHVVFAMRKSDLGAKIVANTYAVTHSVQETEFFNYLQWLKGALKHTAADVLILDVRDGLTRKELNALKDENLLIIDIDDPEEKRLSADLAFYPPAPQVNLLDWKGFKGKVFSGWEWIILRKEFIRKRLFVPDGKAEIVDILVAMGGSDPMGMTLNVLKALGKIAGNLRITVVLGEGFAHLSEMEEMLPGIFHPVAIRKNVQEMASVMRQMDLAVASFGMTAYELASMGVPAVYLCLTMDHLKSANMFIKSRLAYDAWLHNEIEIKDLSEVLTARIGNNYLKKQTDESTFRRVDGYGAKRVANLIMMHKRRLSKNEKTGPLHEKAKYL